jgi:Ca2+-binding RTX toxin-like protein
MRRMTLLFTAMAVALLLGSGTALAALVEGDNRDNTLTGTPMSDIIHAYGGEDRVSALEGRDTIFGGYGTDRLYGGYGDDHLVSRDLNSSGIGQRDVVDCGPGYDTFAADYEDRVLDNCEEGSVGGF